MDSPDEGNRTTERYSQRIAQMLLEAQQECHIGCSQELSPAAQTMFESIAGMLGSAIKTLDESRRASEPFENGEWSLEQANWHVPTGGLPNLSRIPTGKLSHPTRPESGDPFPM